MPGLYFAKWNCLEVPASEVAYKRFALLRFGRSETQFFGYMLHECKPPPGRQLHGTGDCCAVCEVEAGY
jgi:hypothetical protein